MRTKMLVLGAIPPFEGPWIPIQRGVTWGCSIVCQPVGTGVDGQIILNVRDEQGNITSLRKGDPVRGTAVQAVIEEIEGLKMISVFIEEVE